MWYNGWVKYIHLVLKLFQIQIIFASWNNSSAMANYKYSTLEMCFMKNRINSISYVILKIVYETFVLKLCSLFYVNEVVMNANI